MFRSITLPDIPENEIEMNIELNKKIQDLPNILTELDNDILSVTGTSCSFGDLSLSFENNMGCNVQPSLGRSIDCLEKYSSANADIGNISVQSSADVTFGNKTFFNGPVVIKHFVASDGEKPDSSENKTDQRRFKSFECVRKRPVLLGSILTAFVVIVIVVIVAGYFFKLYDNTSPPKNETVDDDYKLINRSQYGAVPSKVSLAPISFPVKVIIIARTSAQNCTNYVDCVDRILQMQRIHMNIKRWDDICWHFLVGGDGKAYEGSGWYGISAIDAIPNNNRIISISFIGHFFDYEAPQKQLYAAQKFIEDGLRMNLIHPDYIFHAHNSLSNESNSNMLYNQIIIWSSLNMSKDVN